MIRIQQEIKPTKEIKQIIEIIEKVQGASCVFQVYTTVKHGVKLEGYILTPDESIATNKWFDGYRNDFLKGGDAN